jgi:hypothetical protein
MGRRMLRVQEAPLTRVKVPLAQDQLAVYMLLRPGREQQGRVAHQLPRATNGVLDRDLEITD